MAAQRCTTNRKSKVLRSCWLSPQLCLELERIGQAKRLELHGCAQTGLEDMIATNLAAQPLP
jgi:hypothetical protein